MAAKGRLKSRELTRLRPECYGVARKRKAEMAEWAGSRLISAAQPDYAEASTRHAAPPYLTRRKGGLGEDRPTSSDRRCFKS